MIAERLLADGHRVCVLDVEPDPECGFDWRACDVTDPDALQSAIDDVVARPGRLDVLVNNAGLISPRKPYRDSDKAELVRYLTVNAVGYVLTVQAAHDALVASGRGCIVNVASRTFFTGSPGQLAYVASKGAVLGLTRVLAKELGPYAVTVNAVIPGQVSTRAPGSTWTRRTSTGRWPSRPSGAGSSRRTWPGSSRSWANPATPSCR